VKLLGLDTATERLIVAVDAGDGSGARVVDVEGGAAASRRIIPEALQLLAQAGLTLRMLDGMAFGQGPGAFTGLRTACAVAQGLAMGVNLPVLRIDSLLQVAEGGRPDWAGWDDGSEVWVAMDARMNEVYAACYRWKAPGGTEAGLGAASGWSTVVEPALYDLDTLHARWQASPPRHVTGNAPAAFGERLQCGAARTLPSEERGAALLRLAAVAHARGQGVDAAEALPVYLRDKVALTTAEREQAKRAAGAAGGGAA